MQHNPENMVVPKRILFTLIYVVVGVAIFVAVSVGITQYQANIGMSQQSRMKSKHKETATLKVKVNPLDKVKVDVPIQSKSNLIFTEPEPTLKQQERTTVSNTNPDDINNDDGDDDGDDDMTTASQTDRDDDSDDTQLVTNPSANVEAAATEGQIQDNHDDDDDDRNYIADADDDDDDGDDNNPSIAIDDTADGNNDITTATDANDNSQTDDDDQQATTMATGTESNETAPTPAMADQDPNPDQDSNPDEDQAMESMVQDILSEVHQNITGSPGTTLFDNLNPQPPTPLSTGDLSTAPSLLAVCNDVQIPAVLPRATESWQTVTTNATYVFSAHRDPRETGRVHIRVFGLMLTRMLVDPEASILYCQLWSPDGSARVVRGVTRYLTTRNRFESFTLHCEFPIEVNLSSVHVLSVTVEACARGRNLLNINDNSELPPSERHRYMVCTSESLKTKFSDFQRFIEWMEMNTLLGAEKTIVYNSSVSSMMDAVLRYYVSKGMLEVVKWWPPLHYTRQMVHQSLANDCLYRSMKRTEFLTMTDIEETLVPRGPHLYTWDDMLNAAPCYDSSYIAARATRFHLNWADDKLYASDRYIARTLHLVGLLKTKREPKFLPIGIQSRHILRPTSISFIKSHQVFLRNGSFEEPCVMSPNVGGVHHYVADVTAGQSSGWILDRALYKHGLRLIRRVSNAYRELDAFITPAKEAMPAAKEVMPAANEFMAESGS